MDQFTVKASITSDISRRPEKSKAKAAADPALARLVDCHDRARSG
jgi:hypothetical protein